MYYAKCVTHFVYLSYGSNFKSFPGFCLTVKGPVVSYKVVKPELWKASIDPYSGYSEYVKDDEVVHYQSVIEIYKNKPNDFERGGVVIEVKNIEKYGKPLTDVFQKYIQDNEVKFGK